MCMTVNISVVRGEYWAVGCSLPQAFSFFLSALCALDEGNSEEIY